MCAAVYSAALHATLVALPVHLLAHHLPQVLPYHPPAPSPSLNQVVSVFSSFGFKWPVQLTKLFAASSMTSFNDQLMAPECSIGTWSFEMKYAPPPCVASSLSLHARLHCTGC
jgi:hypothetical protein